MGIFDERPTNRNELAARLEAMTRSIRHRGPDGDGVWIDDQVGLGLGHRRLAIIDLTEAGRQPMKSSCGRFVVTYNGEIFNALELKRELEHRGHRFRGHSDTEVLVEGFSEWGFQATVERTIGMFAIAAWDRHDKVLYLARDRLGIKPLYWGEFEKFLLFGSELKALRAHDGWKPQLNREAVAAFMRRGYVSGPKTIYRGVRALRPGHIAVRRTNGQVEEFAYWSLERVVERAKASQLDISDADAIDQLESLLRDAVRRRMIADVPLGAFLSGGIDSSLVVALMQAEGTRPVRSFSIGFDEAQYNESEHARRVAQYLGTDHTDMLVSPELALATIPRIPIVYDEPFADASQIPTLIVSELARRHVTVSLSGDGADELFAGYERYRAARTLERLASVPMPIRRGAAAGIRAVPPRLWDRVFAAIPRARRPAQPGDKMHKLARALLSGPDVGSGFSNDWDSPSPIVLGASVHALGEYGHCTQISDAVERMQFFDARGYLPDDILTKVDRASMAVGLEARVPILDHRIVEFSWRLPLRFKIRDGQTKWILRRILDRYVPARLVDRPKMGFKLPLDTWLRGPLREWAENLLNPTHLKQQGILRYQLVAKAWNEHVSLAQNWQTQLWTVLMFQAWLDHARVSL